MMTSGGNSSSSCPYSFFLKSIRSGPFSWTRSTPLTAVARSAANVSLDWDAPGPRPNLLSAGHAASTNRFRAPSAFGATSVAATSRPFARKRAVQLAPMTPVPMMATRRIGLVVMVSLLWIRWSDFGVGDAGEVALGEEQGLLVGAVEIGAVDRAGEIGEEHPAPFQIQGQADAFHQIGEQNLGVFAGAGRWIHGRAVDGIAARRVSAVGPVHQSVGDIEIEIDRLRQVVIE